MANEEEKDFLKACLAAAVAPPSEDRTTALKVLKDAVDWSSFNARALQEFMAYEPIGALYLTNAAEVKASVFNGDAEEWRARVDAAAARYAWPEHLLADEADALKACTAELAKPQGRTKVVEYFAFEMRVENIRQKALRESATDSERFLWSLESPDSILPLHHPRFASMYAKAAEAALPDVDCSVDAAIYALLAVATAVERDVRTQLEHSRCAFALCKHWSKHMSKCAACGAVAYCSKEHQKKHWKMAHKAACNGKENAK